MEGSGPLGEGKECGGGGTVSLWAGVHEVENVLFLTFLSRRSLNRKPGRRFGGEGSLISRQNGETFLPLPFPFLRFTRQVGERCEGKI